MPRNRWQVPGTEWVQILRGPRPPSVKWPKAGQQQQRQPGKPSKPPQFHSEKGGSLSKPSWDRPSMPPQQMRAAATEREVFEAAGRFELNRRFLHTGLEFLDSVDLHVVFRTRALVMKSVPVLLKGAFKAALICAMREVLDGNNQGHELRAERGWKMLMLLPRMLLARPRGGKSVEEEVAGSH